MNNVQFITNLAMNIKHKQSDLTMEGAVRLACEMYHETFTVIGDVNRDLLYKHGLMINVATDDFMLKPKGEDKLTSPEPMHRKRGPDESKSDYRQAYAKGETKSDGERDLPRGDRSDAPEDTRSPLENPQLPLGDGNEK